MSDATTNALQEIANQLSRIADALEGASPTEEEDLLDQEAREQVVNILALVRRERAGSTPVLPFFEELVREGAVVYEDFLRRHEELPYAVTESEDGSLTSRGLMVAIGRAAAAATGYGAPRSYRALGYHEEKNEDGATVAYLSEAVARAARRLL